MDQSRGYDAGSDGSPHVAADAVPPTGIPATVATDADCERRPAGRVGAKPKVQNSVPIDIHLSHSENYVICSDGGPALTAYFTVPPFGWRDPGPV